MAGWENAAAAGWEIAAEPQQQVARPAGSQPCCACHACHACCACCAQRACIIAVAQMQKHQANLLNYNLFIRTAPIFPR